MGRDSIGSEMRAQEVGGGGGRGRGGGVGGVWVCVWVSVGHLR